VDVYFTGFRCVGCSADYAGNQDLLLCPACGSLLDAEYDYAAMGRDLDRDRLATRPNDLWRWSEFLPVVDLDRIVTLGEGGGPLLRSDRLARRFGVREVWLKSDATSPTGSLKDRSIPICATKALEFGYGVLSCDSTGNKASSTAAYAARAGLRSVVFCPQDTPTPKVAQALFFGARLVRVRGHYSEINAMYRRLIHSGKVRWYDCGTDNPYRYEGKKTYAYEIAQGLGWQAPDWVLQPAAGGMSIVKAWKGFNELRQLGWISGLPRLAGVQASACAPIVAAMEGGLPRVAAVRKEPTIASAIAVAHPGLLGDATLQSLRASKGAAAAVSDQDILEATRLLAQEGVFVEPSGAVTVAALPALMKRGTVGGGDRVVCVLTGSGFKDFERIQEMVTIPDRIVGDYGEMEALATELE